VPLQNINVVNATLALGAAQAIDYSTVLIVDCNHLSLDRATTYTSVDGYTSVVPEGTPLRSILDSAFSPTVNPARVVVGRAKGRAVLRFDEVAENDEFTLSINVLDGEQATVSYTAVLGDTQQEVAEGLEAAIIAAIEVSDHVVPSVVGLLESASLEIDIQAQEDDFSLSNVSANIAVSSTITESPSETIVAIRQINTDWTYIVATEHSPAYQADMANQALVFEKPYVTSSDLAEAYQAWDGVSTPDVNDVPSVFVFSNNNFAHCMYHNEASRFPEAGRITLHTAVRPGRDDFQYSVLPGFSLAQVADGSRPLDGNELANLEAKNASTIISLGGNAVIGGNRMSTGIRIEAIAVLNYFRQELTRRTDTLFLNIRKLGINDADIGLIRNAWTSFLDSNVSSGAGNSQALDPALPYIVTLPRAVDVPFDDRVSGKLRAEIICNLDASIDCTQLNLTLTYRDPAQV